MQPDNCRNLAFCQPELIDVPADYFAGHARDIEVLVEHCSYIDIGSPAEAATRTVLEVGAGVGVHTGMLNFHFGRVIATDILKYTALRHGAFVEHVASEHSKKLISLMCSQD